MKLTKRFFWIFSLGLLVATTHAKRTDGEVFDRGQWQELAEELDYPIEQRTSRSNNFNFNDFDSLVPVLEALKYLLYLGVLALLIYAIYRIVSHYASQAKAHGKADKTIYETLEDAEENLRDADFDPLLQASLRNKDYKTAIRILFLKALAQLDEEQRIRWKKQKTNYEYLNELKGDDLKPAFQTTIWHFEQVWYGAAIPDAAYFQALLPAFERLTRKSTNLQ
jgi:hypothetical protein